MHKTHYKDVKFCIRIGADECQKNPDLAILILKKRIDFDKYQGTVGQVRPVIKFDEIKAKYCENWVLNEPYLIVGWQGM